MHVAMIFYWYIDLRVCTCIDGTSTIYSAMDLRARRFSHRHSSSSSSLIRPALRKLSVTSIYTAGVLVWQVKAGNGHPEFFFFTI